MSKTGRTALRKEERMVNDPKGSTTTGHTTAVVRYAGGNVASTPKSRGHKETRKTMMTAGEFVPVVSGWFET